MKGLELTDHGGVAQDLPEQDEEIYRLRVVDRLTFSEIGKRYGISPQAVHQRYQRIAASLPMPDIAAVRAESLTMLREIEREAIAVARMQGAPVTAGKDGGIVYDPEVKDENDNAVVVRDFAGRLQALKLAGWADAEARKLMGADAATKVESTATVKYEMVSIDPEALK